MNLLFQLNIATGNEPYNKPSQPLLHEQVDAFEVRSEPVWPLLA